jgi:hypothetical protein
MIFLGKPWTERRGTAKAEQRPGPAGQGTEDLGAVDREFGAASKLPIYTVDDVVISICHSLCLVSYCLLEYEIDIVK